MNPRRRKPGRFSRRLRGLVFRLLAVLLGLGPFLGVEAGLALLGWGEPDNSVDPFVGFRSVRPLFSLDEERGRYEIAASRQSFFCPTEFPREKGPTTYRIFCLGGSTVQGRPFSIETSFATLLKLSLEAADASRQWEVINCGGVSYASYRLMPILEEVLAYEPDLIVVYTGHNEFLEDRTYSHVKRLPALVAGPCEVVLATRTYTLLHRGYGRLLGDSHQNVPEGRPLLELEADAILEYQDGLDRYHRDVKWQHDVIDHFRYNLGRMVAVAEEANVPLVLVNPACNLRDCPPFKAQHRDNLSPEALRRWESLVAKAADCQGTDLALAVDYLEQAARIDDQHAGLHYLMAKCYDALGQVEMAGSCYRRAKEADICPLRILEPINRAVLEVATHSNAWLVDIQKLFGTLAENGIPGSDLFIDHVHPSIASHQRIANALADEMVRHGVLTPGPAWHATRSARFREQLASLDSFYFAKGLERLERLRCWTQGKGDRTRKPGPRPIGRDSP